MIAQNADTLCGHTPKTACLVSISKPSHKGHPRQGKYAQNLTSVSYKHSGSELLYIISVDCLPFYNTFYNWRPEFCELQETKQRREKAFICLYWIPLIMVLKQLHQQKDAITRRSEFALLSLQFCWLP